MPRRWVVLIGVVIARVAFSFQLQSVAVVAPGLADGLGLDSTSLGTIIGLFMLPGLVLAIPGGLLSEWFGERRFVVACLAAMVVGGLICGLADNYHWLWIGRLIAGIGAIGINVAMIKIVIDWFQGKEIATATALYVTSFAVGIALALVTLGPLATADSWPVALFSAAGLSFIALIVFLATYRPAERAKEDIGPAPKLSLGEIGMVSLSGLIWALQNGAYIVMVMFIPIFLVSEGMTMTTATSLMGIGVWVSIFTSPVGGMFADKFGRPDVVIVAGVLISRLGLLLVIPWSNSVPLLLAPMFAFTIIGGLSGGPIVALASQALRPETRAAGMGIFYSWLYAGLALGPMMGGFVSDLAGHPVAPIYLISALGILTVIILGLFRGLQARGFPSALSLGKT